MKKILLPLLATSFISGCAFYQGMHDVQTQTEETTKKHAIKVDVPPSPKPANNSNQNSPTNVGAKMISPLTQ